MKSGHITKAVQFVFKKAGLDVKITSTSFWKAAVTKVHIDKPDMNGGNWLTSWLIMKRRPKSIIRKIKDVSGGFQKPRTADAN